MGAALLSCRLVLALVFVTAGVAKLFDAAGTREAALGFGAGERISRLAGRWLPVVELAIGIALVPLPAARYGAVAAASMLVVFTGAIALTLARGAEVDCHCFGNVRRRPVGWPALARNAALLGAAGFVAVAGWQDAGISATGWVRNLSGVSVAVIVAALVVAALIAFLGWFCLQLLAQNGRILARLEYVESSLNGVSNALGVIPDAPPADTAVSHEGLPVGSPAPEFDLVSASGERCSLASLLTSGKRVLLAFTATGCGPCEVLLPRLAEWQERYADRLEIALIASGDRASIGAQAREHGLKRALVQAGREVAEAYHATATPMAVLLDDDGRILSPTVAGVQAIETLIGQPAPLPVPPVDRGTRIGEPAPDLVLEALDGGTVHLSDLYGERTVAVFWNPRCGFCEQMLPALHALDPEPPAGAPELLVISLGETDEIADQVPGGRVVRDPGGRAMNAFGARGTPMAVLIERGRIASELAAGADDVLALLRAPGLSVMHW